MQDDLDMDMLIYQMEATNLFDSNEELQLLQDSYNLPYDSPITIIKNSLFIAYNRYKRYKNSILFDDSEQYILDMINEFLDINRSQNNYYEFCLMKRIDGEILKFISKNNNN